MFCTTPSASCLLACSKTSSPDLHCSLSFPSPLVYHLKFLASLVFSVIKLGNLNGMPCLSISNFHSLVLYLALLLTHSTLPPLALVLIKVAVSDSALTLTTELFLHPTLSLAPLTRSRSHSPLYSLNFMPSCFSPHKSCSFSLILHSLFLGRLSLFGPQRGTTKTTKLSSGTDNFFVRAR